MEDVYDVVILGGGINGVGIASTLAQSGKSVLIIDKNSIGYGASSHSSRLIHGGLRYLEHFHFGLVKEALADRTRLVQKYPDLVNLIPFYMPIYKDSPRPAWMIRAGLWLYDILSGHIAPHHKVNRDDFSKMFPAVKSQALSKVFHYYDAKTNDLLLTQTVANEAKSFGCDFLLGEKPQKIHINEEAIQIQLAERTIETQTCINATGAWIDEVNDAYDFPSNYRIQKVSGIHLVIKGLLVAHPLFLQASRERIFFVIPEPENDQTLIGTTERTENLPCDEIRIHEEDIDYLLNEINRYLKKPLGREDIVSTYIGVRPLIQSKKSEFKISREYKLDLHKKGSTRLLHVYGGKLTTFYALSQKVKKLLR